MLLLHVVLGRSRWSKSVVVNHDAGNGPVVPAPITTGTGYGCKWSLDRSFCGRRNMLITISARLAAPTFSVMENVVVIVLKVVVVVMLDVIMMRIAALLAFGTLGALRFTCFAAFALFRLSLSLSCTTAFAFAVVVT